MEGDALQLVVLGSDAQRLVKQGAELSIPRSVACRILSRLKKVELPVDQELLLHTEPSSLLLLGSKCMGERMDALSMARSELLLLRDRLFLFLLEEPFE